MTLEQLPYEVWETILWKLDGVSLLALSCVSTICHSYCQSFLKIKDNDYWRKLCLRELNTVDIELCQSGTLKENWYTVYKAAHIKNTIQRRRVLATTITLCPRFIKCRTGVHILGDLLVITAGPLISVFGAKACEHLTNRGAGGFNIHKSFILPKSGTEMHSSTKSGILACDVLVLLVGGANISHMAVFSAYSIRTPGDVLFPIDYRPYGDASEQSFICQRFNNRVCVGGLSIQVTVRETTPSVTILPTCSCHLTPSTYFHSSGLRRTAFETVDKGGRLSVDTGFNSTVAVVVNEPDSIVICTAKRDEVHMMSIPVEGELLYKSAAHNHQLITNPFNIHPNHKAITNASQGSKATLQQDAVKILHNEGEVLPVIAAVQRSQSKGKHVVLYSFPL